MTLVEPYLPWHCFQSAPLLGDDPFVGRGWPLQTNKPGKGSLMTLTNKYGYKSSQRYESSASPSRSRTPAAKALRFGARSVSVPTSFLLHALPD